MQAETPLLRLATVTKILGRHKVLDRISIDISRGSSVLIQGPSGCGKTTILRCAALLEKIDEGQIVFKGRTVLAAGAKPHPDRDVRLKISMVFQHLHLWPHLTVLENITLPLRLLGASDVSANEKALSVLGLLNISEKKDEYPLSLSGGQQQRVALARALVHSPDLLLLDEITSNLDVESAGRVLHAVEEIWRRGTAVVIVSHANFIPTPLKQTVLRFDQGRWCLTTATNGAVTPT